MADRLFGVETEYALSGLHKKKAGSTRDLASGLLDLIRTTRLCLPDHHASGVYLQNGARFYIDAGMHPEMTTPECTTPWDVVRFVAAGDRILADVADVILVRRPHLSEIVLSRINVDYESSSTWGCHESYLHSINPGLLPVHLIPHLVSRIIYTGAGGFDTSKAGIDFLVSPRTMHLEHERSGDSTHDRAILHTKDEPLSSAGYHRLHLICGESLCSHLGQWLKIGTTAVVVAMIEHGLTLGIGLELQHAVAAMRTFARDPNCRVTVRTKNGQLLSALAIQRRYLEAAEAQAGAWFMPSWTDIVCHQWRMMLDRLEQGPAAVATTLDWAIKLTLFERHAARRGFTWPYVALWSRVLHGLREALRMQGLGPHNIYDAALLSPSSPVQPAVQHWASFLRGHDLTWESFRSFVALRDELRELDIRFSQLGRRGLFSALDAENVLSHGAPGVEDIAAAMTDPPTRGRGHVRGTAIALLANNGGNAAADWIRVDDYSGNRRLDLSDPFCSTMQWQPMDSVLNHPDRLELLLERAAGLLPGRLRR